MFSTRRTAALAVAIALAAPAVSQASTATVVSVDRGHHILRAITGPATVAPLRWRGRLSRGIRPGTKVRYAHHGRFATRLRAIGRTASVDLPGEVNQTPAGGTTVTLPDGTPLPALHGLNVSVSNLPPGTSVVVHITFGPGGVDVTIEVTGPAPAAAAQSSGDSSSDGCDGCSYDDSSGDDTSDDGASSSCAPDAVFARIAGVNRRRGLLAVRTPGGDEHVLGAADSTLAGVHEGDVAVVRFAGDQVTGLSVLESTAGSALDPNELVADGTVVRINSDAEQATIAPHGAPRLTLDLPCWAADALWTAEDVHVAYHHDSSGDLVLDAVVPNDGSAL